MALVSLHQETQELPLHPFPLPPLSFSLCLPALVCENTLRRRWSSEKTGSVSSLDMGFAAPLILDFLLPEL